MLYQCRQNAVDISAKHSARKDNCQYALIVLISSSNFDSTEATLVARPSYSHRAQVIILGFMAMELYSHRSESS